MSKRPTTPEDTENSSVPGDVELEHDNQLFSNENRLLKDPSTPVKGGLHAESDRHSAFYLITVPRVLLLTDLHRDHRCAVPGLR